MPEESQLSDELLRHLMAVGRVDVLVGIPTLNNAETIASVVRASQQAFAKYFPRDRTVLINSDGGSEDGTPGLVRSVSADEAGTLTTSHGLRTTHRISVPYHGVPGKGNALRQILSAADLTQARAVAVLDPGVSNFTPEWIAALIQPVRSGPVDFVSPIQPRHPLEGALVSQLVRPLVRATYGWRVAEPLAVEFAGSTRFVSHCLEDDFWTSPLANNGIDMWVTATALSSGFRCCEVPLGRRRHGTPHARLGFPEVFTQVTTSVFECLELDDDYWFDRSGSEPLALIGDPVREAIDAPAIVSGGLTRSFRDDLVNLRPVLEPILSVETLGALTTIAATPPDQLRFGDDTWVRTVYEFLVAYHARVMNREHIVQALVPLYLGRAGSFLAEHANDDQAAADALEALGATFEQAKPYLVDRWNATTSR